MIVDTDSQNIPTKKILEKNVPAIGIVDYESDQEKSDEIDGKMKMNIVESGDEGPESADVRAKYSTYKMFWGLQSYMSSENSKRFTDCPAASAVAVGGGGGGGTLTVTASTGSASGSGGSGTNSAAVVVPPSSSMSATTTTTTTATTPVDSQKAEWQSFMGHANSVLLAFEKGKK